MTFARMISKGSRPGQDSTYLALMLMGFTAANLCPCWRKASTKRKTLPCEFLDARTSSATGTNTCVNNKNFDSRYKLFKKGFTCISHCHGHCHCPCPCHIGRPFEFIGLLLLWYLFFAFYAPLRFDGLAARHVNFRMLFALQIFDIRY